GGGAGSVYPLLAALEAAGFISGRDEGDRRIYELTDKGKKMLEERAADIGRFFEVDDEEEGAGDTRAQMREAADRLMRAVSQMGYSSKPETVERVRDLLDEARKKIYEVLAQE
ncbi:MAG: PadR family transcriptional regulator, partial [Candidatus Cybelea sp.]